MPTTSFPNQMPGLPNPVPDLPNPLRSRLPQSRLPQSRLPQSRLPTAAAPGPASHLPPDGSCTPPDRYRPTRASLPTMLPPIPARVNQGGWPRRGALGD